MNGIKNIDALILMNDLQQLTQPSSTAVGTTVPSGEDFQRNRTQNLANQVGSIGSPQGLSEEELLDIVMSSATRSPMMGSIRGGKQAMSVFDQLFNVARKYMTKTPERRMIDIIKSNPGKKMTQREIIDAVKDRTALSKARIRNQYVLDEHGIEDPDKIFRGFSQN